MRVVLFTFSYVWQAVIASPGMLNAVKAIAVAHGCVIVLAAVGVALLRWSKWRAAQEQMHRAEVAREINSQRMRRASYERRVTNATRVVSEVFK